MRRCTTPWLASPPTAGTPSWPACPTRTTPTTSYSYAWTAASTSNPPRCATGRPLGCGTPIVGPPRAPVDADQLRSIVAAVDSAGARLHLLRPDQVFDLAAAADQAQRGEAAEAAWQAELGYWTGGTRPLGSGIPDAAIPHDSPQTTVPGRDFGHPGDLPIPATHDNAAEFAILYGREDGKIDWLRAGEALSAGWLTATELGIAVLPLSATRSST